RSEAECRLVRSEARNEAERRLVRSEARSEAECRLIGQRVVGEINAYCGECPTCRAGRPTHCPHRTTLGIWGRDGAFAEYLTLPIRNLHVVPDDIPDEAAVFTEPLAAALEILEGVHIRPTDRVVVLGDGKLGLLVAQVLALLGGDLTVVGRHREKLAILARRGIPTALESEAEGLTADVVVECTGKPEGFAAARRILRPRGTLVLKSTYHGRVEADLTGLVVDEITLVGSRCGPFPPALRLLQRGLVDVQPLISAIYPLARGVEAFARAAAIYARLPGAELQLAHVDMQVAVLALAGGVPEEALRLADRAIPVVQRHDNPALLANLMLIKAEALEALGTPAAAAALRMDSAPLARYGFGSDGLVRSRMRDIASLAGRAERG
ncbi:MAG: zinc-binding dehydrogenase, partial [Tabrizicola sp.]